MNHDFSRLMHGYFDDTLTDDEHRTLVEWLHADPSHAREFAELALLHDHLRNHLSHPHHDSTPLTPARMIAKQNRGWRRTVVALLSACVMFVVAIGVWHLLATQSASAAVVELQRLLAASERASDRTYHISVEETASLSPHEATRELGRPPKPSLNDALLFVRRPNLFVLRRKTETGEFFVTGSDGRQGWAVRPDGPVRVSSDLSRFNRDVPGHEHNMPLSNLHDGLQQVSSAYDIQIMPIEDSDAEKNLDADPNRLMVAVKKHGWRGPRRVEITYGASSGEVRQMRFIDMPYGPERLTIRLTLIDVSELPTEFFHHEAHHDPARAIVFEE